MHIGKLVFSQVIDSLPMHAFRRGVARYDGNRHKKTFSCLDQYLRMTFAQLTHRESLCDIEVGLDNFSIFRYMLRLCYVMKKQIFTGVHAFRKPNSD